MIAVFIAATDQLSAHRFKMGRSVAHEKERRNSLSFQRRSRGDTRLGMLRYTVGFGLDWRWRFLGFYTVLPRAVATVIRRCRIGHLLLCRLPRFPTGNRLRSRRRVPDTYCHTWPEAFVLDHPGSLDHIDYRSVLDSLAILRLL